MQRLLLVDNGDYFTSRGFCVTACENAGQAFAHAEKFPVDCVILDIRMPGVDGFELCRRFKSQMTAPVIFLTGFTEKEYLYQGFSLGGDDFLTRPRGKEHASALWNGRLFRVPAAISCTTSAVPFKSASPAAGITSCFTGRRAADDGASPPLRL